MGEKKDSKSREGKRFNKPDRQIKNMEGSSDTAGKQRTRNWESKWFGGAKRCGHTADVIEHRRTHRD